MIGLLELVMDGFLIVLKANFATISAYSVNW